MPGFQIQRPDIWAQLQRLFRVFDKGTLQLERSVVPTVQVADLSLGALPPIMRHATAEWDQAAVAGENFVGRFETPSGVICQIKRMVVTPPTGATQLVAHSGSTLTAPANIARKSYTDGRVLERSELPAGVFSFDTAAGGLGATIEWRYNLTANVANVIDFPDGWVVGNGQGGSFGFIEFSVGNANTRVFGTIEWDEFQVV